MLGGNHKKMAIFHFLRPESGLRIRRYELSTTVRWLSVMHTDTKSETGNISDLNKTSLPKKLRAEAVESFVKKYMESNPGSFPKATLIQKEVGGSFYTVKNILSTLKEKMLGTKQPRNDQNPNLPTLGVHPLSDIEQNRQSDTGILPEADVHSSREQNLGHASVNAAKESSSTLVTGSTDSEITDEHISSSSSVLPSESIVLSAKIGYDFQASKRMTEGARKLQAKEATSTKQDNSGWSMSAGSVKYSLGKAVDKRNDGNGYQPEKKTLSGNQFSNSYAEIRDKSDFPDNSQKVAGLAEMFRHETCDETAVKTKNQLLQSSAVPSGFTEDKVSPASKLSTFDMASPSESPRKLQCLFERSRLTSYGSGIHPPEDEKTIQSENVPSAAGLITAFKNSVENIRMSNDQALDGSTNRKGGHLINNSLDRINERKEPEAKGSEIRGLIGCIKQIPPLPSASGSFKNIPTHKMDENSEGKFVSSAKPQFKSPKKGKTSLFNFVSTDSKVDGPSHTAPAKLKTQDDESTRPECLPPTFAKPKMSAQPLLKGSDDTQKKISSTNKLVMKFLPICSKESEIHDAFRGCGGISSIELPVDKGAFFIHANVYFKTREGLRKALQKSDYFIASRPVTVEAAGFVNSLSNKISIPDLIGDPNFPAALGKNPARTVMITPLTHDISACHVESALSSCGGKVTGFFLGSSNSVAYVEFETEEAKERALVKHSIDVLGKKVLISRIDVPRTIVIRIYHTGCQRPGVSKLCNSLGKVRHVRPRSKNITDVHFRVAEWPNMPKILNSINGAELDGKPLVAEPAPVIPPEILSVLMSQLDGRRYVDSMMQILLQKVDGNVVQRPEIPDLIKNFY